MKPIRPSFRRLSCHVRSSYLQKGQFSYRALLYGLALGENVVKISSGTSRT
jgi:hypothetical protein